jgi:hypothetical protein
MLIYIKEEKMKKGFLLFFMVSSLILFTPSEVQAKNAQDKLVKTFVEECSETIEQWNNVTSVRGEKLYNYADEVIGEIYRVYDSDTQYGYVLYLDETGITEAAWEGRDRAQDIKGRVYYVMPGKFFSREEMNEYVQSQMDNNVESQSEGALAGSLYHTVDAGSGYYTIYNYSITLQSSYFPDLTDNVTYVGSTWSLRYDVENVPDYLALITNGCAPTAGAMFVGYYDNEIWDSLSTFDGTGSYPDSYVYAGGNYYNYTTVVNLINELADYMDYNPSDGTYPYPMAVGLEEFFHDSGYTSYNVLTGLFSENTEYYPGSDDDVNLGDYEYIIRKGNVAIINMYNNNTYGNHSTLGMGYLYARTAGMGAIIHDGFPTEMGYPVEVFITYDALDSYYFIASVNIQY